MIPWIQIYSNLISHPKTSRLADILKLASKDTTPNVIAAGMLISLWTWAIQNACSGDLSTCSDRAIADAARYRRKPEVFVAALIDAGWIDTDRHLHNWEEYTALLITRMNEQKEKTRQRVKRYRSKKETPNTDKKISPCNGHSNVTETPCNADTLPIPLPIPLPVSNISTPNTGDITLPPQETPAPFDRRSFTAFWDAYPKKHGREAAWEAWRKLAPSPEVVALIMSNLEKWKCSGQWTEDGDRYIPKAVNFLSDEGYWKHAPALPRSAVPTGASGELGVAEREAIQRVLAQSFEEGDL